MATQEPSVLSPLAAASATPAKSGLRGLLIPRQEWCEDPTVSFAPAVKRARSVRLVSPARDPSVTLGKIGLQDFRLHREVIALIDAGQAPGGFDPITSMGVTAAFFASKKQLDD